MPVVIVFFKSLNPKKMGGCLSDCVHLYNVTIFISACHTWPCGEFRISSSLSIPMGGCHLPAHFSSTQFTQITLINQSIQVDFL